MSEVRTRDVCFKKRSVDGGGCVKVRGKICKVVDDIVAVPPEPVDLLEVVCRCKDESECRVIQGCARSEWRRELEETIEVSDCSLVVVVHCGT